MIRSLIFSAAEWLSFAILLIYRQEAGNVIKTIRNKLDGIEESSLLRSDTGQVSYLIESATNPDNLSKMYVGWAPFL